MLKSSKVYCDCGCQDDMDLTCSSGITARPSLNRQSAFVLQLSESFLADPVGKEKGKRPSAELAVLVRTCSRTLLRTLKGVSSTWVT